jgi:excisionase family DNA binding protein
VVEKRSVSRARPRAKENRKVTAESGRKIAVTVEVAARLFATSPARIRAAAARGELEAEDRAGELFVLVDLELTLLSSPQAARLLGVQTQTVRKDVRSGRLRGTHDRGSRGYRIRLRELASDRRFPADLAAVLLLGQPSPREEPHPTRRRSPELAGAVVPLNVLLRPEDAEALAVGVERFGTKRAAVSAALRQLGASIPYEAELRRRDAQLEQCGEVLARSREEVSAARERAARLPAELWCHGCSAWIPLEQLQEEESRELGGVAWAHRHEGLTAVLQGRATPLGRHRYG